MKRLIVTGDDFGASTLVNEAIEQAHRAGVLNT
ncbi:MAG: ChbG/HpnK family deacetylase, partial [Candidatus Eremiobacteraeota bacterium]|nr:ChbG/HpnK family deacetylase [Candidatus Eremiobacteraeota bacterium]